MDKVPEGRLVKSVKGGEKTQIDRRKDLKEGNPRNMGAQMSSSCRVKTKRKGMGLLTDEQPFENQPTLEEKGGKTLGYSRSKP